MHTRRLQPVLYSKTPSPTDTSGILSEASLLQACSSRVPERNSDKGPSFSQFTFFWERESQSGQMGTDDVQYPPVLDKKDIHWVGNQWPR